MIQPNKHFTDPVVCTTNEKDWYIYFQFLHVGKWDKRKLREGINRVKDTRQRKQEARALQEMRFQWLIEGWNPVTDPNYLHRDIKTETGLKAMPICKALYFALENKSLASKSRIDYKNILNHIETSCILHGYNLLPISELRRVHVLDIMQKIKKDRAISNHGYNKYLGCISSMCSTLESWGALEFNPATKIKQLPVAESNKYEVYTEIEKEKISNELQKSQHGFYVFFLTFYDTGIRPKELLSLRVGDVDLENQIIKIVPDLTLENSKTKFIRYVPISNELLPYIENIGLHNYPTDYFLFGSLFSDRNSGSDIKGVSGVMRKDYFKPSANKIKRDTVTKLWKKLIIDKLGIKKYLYAAKHTGGNDKIIAGIDIDAVREGYGHRSRHMTENYAKVIKQVNAKQIREKTPAFTAKVISIAS